MKPRCLFAILPHLALLPAVAAAQELAAVHVQPESAEVGQPVRVTVRLELGHAPPGCGLKVAFGDGSSRTLRADQPALSLVHTYARGGTYTVQVTGGMYVGGLRTAFPCAGAEKTAQVNVIDAAARERERERARQQAAARQAQLELERAGVEAAERLKELEARERELLRREAELREAAAKRERELAEHERALQQRERFLAAREEALRARDAALKEREQELATRRNAARSTSRQPSPVPETTTAPSPAAGPATAAPPKLAGPAEPSPEPAARPSSVREPRTPGSTPRGTLDAF